MSSDRQELIRRFAVAIAGAHQASDFRSYKLSSDEVWRIATSLADAERKQPQPQPQPADERMRRALQLIAQLADTASLAHKDWFGANGENNGWRVAEAMREIANDVVGNDRIEQPEHTQEVRRLSSTVESLEVRIRRAAALLRGATRYDTAAGFAVTEDRVDEAVQILEGQE